MWREGLEEEEEVQKGEAGGEDCPAKTFVFVSTNGGVKEGGC